jgi:hypothetical protein
MFTERKSASIRGAPGGARDDASADPAAGEALDGERAGRRRLGAGSVTSVIQSHLLATVPFENSGIGLADILAMPLARR